MDVRSFDNGLELRQVPRVVQGLGKIPTLAAVDGEMPTRKLFSVGI